LGISFDHLIGAIEKCRWDFDTKHFGVLQINYKFKSGRLLDGKVTRVRSVQYLLDIIARSPKHFRTDAPYRTSPPASTVASLVENAGIRFARATSEILSPESLKRGIRQNLQRVRVQRDNCCKNFIQFANRFHLKRYNLNAEWSRLLNEIID